MTNSQPLVLVVFGPQGAGKGTQSAILAQHLGLSILEAGALLRQRAAVDVRVHQIVSNGILVDDETIRQIIENELIRVNNPLGYILDGYPRDLTQFNGFKTLAQNYNWRVIAIFLNLSDESAKARLQARFHLVNGQPTKREDDKPEIVARRLETFRRETLPLHQKFRDEFELIEIDGEPAIETVSQEIAIKLKALLND